jgi:uncharacterized protein YraI
MSDHRSSTTSISPAVAALATLVLSAWAQAAFATPAQVMATVHLRAGPATDYPAFAVLGPGTPLEVYGCEENYEWCDVQAGPNRGWVDGAYLQMSSGGQSMIVADSGVVLAVPIVTFVLDTYWGSYYRGRPWYARRAHYYPYYRRYPHGRPPPRPRPPVVRPPPRPSPGIRPPRPQPPVGTRPPGGTRPPVGTRPPGGSRPPGGGGRPPNTGRPDAGNPQPSTRPAPQPTQ